MGGAQDAANTIMKAMVLAAGVGSRLDPLTTQLPKPLVPVGNRPVMEHILRLLSSHEINSVISNLHYLPKQITEYFKDGSAWKLHLEFNLEEELSGDAGGVRACKSFLQDNTFIVMMGDLLTDADLSEIIARHKEKKAIATIALKEVEDVSAFGVALLNSDSYITGFQEKPSIKSALSNLASTGIYVLEPEIFKYIPADGIYGFGRQLFPHLVAQGLKVLGAPINSYWSDVGTIKQYKQTNFDALRGLIKLDLPGRKCEFGCIDSGSIVDPSVVVQGLLLVGKNSQIGPGVTITGHVIIGDNCCVETGAQLEDSIIWSNTTIEANACVTNSVIGASHLIKTGSKHTDVVCVPLPEHAGLYSSEPI